MLALSRYDTVPGKLEEKPPVLEYNICPLTNHVP